MALQGRVCIVTGASRGIGKGIAVQLGEAGAIVYITARTLNPTDGKSGSLEETAAEVTRRGGQGIAVQCDHKNQDEVTKLFERVNTEQNGRLDLLVNSAFSAGKALIPCMDKKFYEIPGDIWDEVNEVALRNCYYCAWHAAKMMVPRKQGLIISISSLVAVTYMVNVAIGVGKAASDRMIADMAVELKDTGVSCLTLWPGTVMTENMVDILNGANDFSFLKELRIAAQYAETPEYAGIAVVSLMKDEKNLQKKSGRVLVVAELGEHYGFKDIDGQRPLSFRSVKNLLLMTGHTFLARFFPRCVKIPKWVFTLVGGKF